MKLLPLLRAFALSVCAVPFAFALAGCGVDVATCGTSCGPDGVCVTRCDDEQAKCAASGAGSDFQALLTCVDNANGTLDDLPSLCEAAQATVTKNCTGTPVVGDAAAD